MASACITRHARVMRRRWSAVKQSHTAHSGIVVSSISCRSRSWRDGVKSGCCGHGTSGDGCGGTLAVWGAWAGDGLRWSASSMVSSMCMWSCCRCCSA
eukprot:4775844-Pleurochrysis_carterae.AAC.1